ncbi:DnaD domain-containing protein [Lacticaseibacillus suibinensis]|uniref:DnaD domain-containing protein n=1 Tax=Lacticaseibacillus suibinensis TaxID=2486011 RepID=UPI001945ABB6|nr:DnaD domain protein [Lacticaseibacillus suibinensis]
MNIYLLLREFYIRQSVNPLSTGQIAMWHALVYQCNQLGWPSEFNMPNRTLETLTGLSRAGISKSRNVLKQSGLIDFRSNGTKSSTYRVVDITTTSDSTQGSTQRSTQRSTQGSTQRSTQRSTQNSSTYLRLDKTKQDKTKDSLSDGGAHETNAFTEWQKVWGFPNAIAQGDLVNWVQEFGDDLVCWVISYAARRAVQAKSADGYLEKTLSHYRGAGISTVEQAEAEAKQHAETAKANAPRPQQSRYGKPRRQEAVPEWMAKDYKAPKQEVSAEAKETLAEQLKELEQLRKGKDEDANTKTMA